MQEEIGSAAGKIWHTLDAKGELSLTHLRREVNWKTPIFDWAIGCLAREDKIVITEERRSFCIRLKEARARAARVS
jgi:winged helix-turn-helix protein DUF2582